MKKILLLFIVIFVSFQSNAQYRWEFSGGITNSSLTLEDTETSNGTGFYVNAGYGYVMGVRAKTSVVFSIEALQRKSTAQFDLGNFTPDDPPNIVESDLSIFQIGFSPKFRYLFFTGKDRFRPFVNVGPSFRYSASVKLGDVELESDQYEQLMIGGVYGAGFSQMIGEMFDIFFEAGAMNDFLDNLNDTESKFFDIYARVGVRFRIYDARR